MEIIHLAKDNPGQKVIMMGNEAIARGIFEAGVKVGAGYPGTPSSEILSTLAAMNESQHQMILEWSINEKVGFEVAYGASMANVRAVACMKHVGVNVAADTFMTACYTGVRGGMVLISADDPNSHSSQNEQDNRFYGLHALIPVFEPSSPNEAKELIKHAFKFSEQYNTIVLFRTTTRLNHGRGDVILGDIIRANRMPGFEWNVSRWVCLPSHSRLLRVNLLERISEISEIADDFPFNSLKLNAKKIKGKRYGFISSGVPHEQLMDALSFLGVEDQVSILKLGMVYPVPRKLILELLNHSDEVMVVEELEPILENEIKRIAREEKVSQDVLIHGKDYFSQNGEFTPELYLENLSKFLSLNTIEATNADIPLEIPARLPLLCPGCGHRTLFYALKLLEKELKTKLVKSSDIGCYTLAAYKPLEGLDIQIAMGASIGLANGLIKVQPKKNPVVAIIGDSTFFHSGIPALINAVYNRNEILIIILDNLSTSMTGFQDNPGTGLKINGEMGTQVKLEELVKGCGVPAEKLWVEDSYNLKGLLSCLREAIHESGVRVLISRHLCSLLERNKHRKQGIITPKIEIDPETCKGCLICINKFGCPAIEFDLERKKPYINLETCRGCKVCLEVCPHGAIHEVS